MPLKAVLLVVFAMNFVHAIDDVVENDSPSNETKTELATEVKSTAERLGPEPPPSTG